MNARATCATSSGLSEAAREGLYATGHALCTQERHAEAAAIFRIMLRIAPADERSWLALGETHERAGHHELALDLYTAGTVASPSAARCHLAIARLLRGTGDTERAQEHLEHARAIAEAADDELLAEIVRREEVCQP